MKKWKVFAQQKQNCHAFDADLNVWSPVPECYDRKKFENLEA